METSYLETRKREKKFALLQGIIGGCLFGIISYISFKYDHYIWGSVSVLIALFIVFLGISIFKVDDCLLKLTCRHCNEEYLIGVDSDIITENEIILDVILTPIPLSQQIIIQNKPDLVDHRSLIYEKRNHLEVTVSRIMVYVRPNFPLGYLGSPRQWLCNHCKGINSYDL